MLPGHVAGHYAREDLEIDLVRLARFAGARLVMARAAGLDLAARRVSVEERPDIAFDLLSIDVGVTSAMPEIPGFVGHAVPAKPLDAFAARWRAFLAAPSGDVAVIGGGGRGLRAGDGDGPCAARGRLGRAHHGGRGQGGARRPHPPRSAPCARGRWRPMG